MKKIVLYLLHEENGIHSVWRDKVPKNSGFLLIITGWGVSGKVILRVSIAVFFGHCRKIFRAKMAQPPPLEKNLPVRLWCRPIATRVRIKQWSDVTQRACMGRTGPTNVGHSIAPHQALVPLSP